MAKKSIVNKKCVRIVPTVTEELELILKARDFRHEIDLIKESVIILLKESIQDFGSIKQRLYAADAPSYRDGRMVGKPSSEYLIHEKLIEDIECLIQKLEGK
jgi:hypothetical protein